VLNGDWQVTSVVETSELRWLHWSRLGSTSDWLSWDWDGLWFVEGEDSATLAVTLLQGLLGVNSNAKLSLVDLGDPSSACA